MSKQEGQTHESTYVLDAENVAEMARLRKQHELVTRTMGGLLAEHADLSSFHDVLDIASGPGGWVLDLAAANPHMQVTGADLSHLMIDFARSLAVEKGLNNAHFRLMSILDTFEFNDASFDLVNARYMAGILTPQAWPQVIAEMVRVTRPGGIVRLTEPEMGTSNNPAMEELTSLFMRSLLLSGQSFSPDGRNIGVTSMLPGLLRDAGLINVRYKAYVTEISAGTPDYTDALQDTVVALKLIQPYLSKMGLTTKEHAEQLYQQAIEGMQSASFRGMYFMLSAWGEVPPKD